MIYKKAKMPVVIAEPISLKDLIDKIISHLEIVSCLMDDANAKYGCEFYNATTFPNKRCDIHIKRGLEEVEKATEREAAQVDGFAYLLRKVKYRGAELIQYADDATKTFTKAFGKAPKIQIVEDADDEK